ncbi:MAG: hypothetical protein ABIR96_05730 [Bdellovibrionota bacterium]
MRIFGREIPFNFNFNFKLTPRMKGLLAFACFIAGLIFFFPIESLESRLNDSLSRALRMDVRISNPRLGFGLKTGLISGGLIGLKAERLEVTSPRTGQFFQCLQPVVSPKILALLLLRIQVAIRCDIGQSAAPIFVVVRAPLYNLDSTSADIQFDDVSAEDVASFASIKGLSGLLNGHVHADSFRNPSQGMALSWDLTATNLQTPALVSDFASLPPLSFEKVSSAGSYQKSRLHIEHLTMGSESKGPFYADIKLDFGLDDQGMPVSGSMTGKQKSDPAFEKSELSSINLDLLFGKVKSSGLREFRKDVNGSAMSLLMPVSE